MKRILCLAAALLVLWGCQGKGDLASQLLVDRQAVSVALAYSADGGELAATVSRLLGEQVSSNTANALLVESHPQENPLDALAKGEAQLALVTSQELSQVNHDLSLLTGPFLWSDYLNFTASANSAQGREMIQVLLSDSVDTKVLGAFYGGGKNLLFRTEFLTDSDPAKYPMGLRSSSAVGAALYSAGFPIVALDGPQIQEEFLQGELEGMEGGWDTAAMMAQWVSPLFVMPTHHQVDCLWLVADRESWDKLSDDFQVKVQDSVAAALAISDRQILDEEEKNRNLAEERGAVELSDRYRSLEEITQEYLEETYGTRQNNGLLELCQEMR